MLDSFSTVGILFKTLLKLSTTKRTPINLLPKNTTMSLPDSFSTVGFLFKTFLILYTTKRMPKNLFKTLLQREVETELLLIT